MYIKYSQFKLFKFFLWGWPAISTYFIILYGILFTNHTIIFSFIFSYHCRISSMRLMSNKLIFIVTFIVINNKLQYKILYLARNLKNARYSFSKNNEQHAIELIDTNSITNNVQDTRLVPKVSRPRSHMFLNIN